MNTNSPVSPALAPKLAPSLSDTRRVLRSLVQWEVAAAFRRAGRAAPAAIGPHAPLGEAGVGLDSLDLIELSTTVAERFDLYSSGTEDNLLRRPTIARWAGVVHAAMTSTGPHAALVFRTSGSTDEARAHRHPLARLAAEAATFAALVPATRRVLALAPAHHIYGFIHTVLLPAAAGVPVFDASDWGPGRMRRELRAGDLIVAFPLRWAQLARTVDAFPLGVTGVTSTAPMPPELARTLVRHGLSRLLQVYGSTETAGIGWRDEPEAPFRLLPRFVRGADGTLDEVDGERGIELPDHVEWTGDRLLSPQGRRDNAVQVGGVNVWPQRVARTLRSHPDVQDCAVRRMRPDEGERLKAFVVLRPASRGEARRCEQSLAEFLQARLSAPERPALAFGDCLPMDANGKPADWALPGGATHGGSIPAPLVPALATA